MQPMSKVRSLLLACAVLGGWNNAAAPLPACSAALPSGAMPTVGPMGSSVCGGIVSLAAAGDLSVPGYVVVGPALAVSGSGPFAHGLDYVLPYTSSKVPKAIEDQVVVLLQRGKAPAHAAMVTNIVVEGSQAKVHFHVPDTATVQLAIP